MSISMNSQSALHEVESRCTQERPPRCQFLCPLGLDARAFLGHAAEGRWSDARKQLERYLPLPGLLARVCDHPCEQGCLRGDLGGAVNLHGLEIFCTKHLGVQTRSLPMPRKQKRIAVIGAGLAGLVCAWDLAGKGYPVTVFHEGDPKAQLLSCWPVLAGAGAAALDAEWEALGRRGVRFEQASTDASCLQQAVGEYDGVLLDAGALPELAPAKAEMDAQILHWRDNICCAGWASVTPTGHRFASASRQAGQGRSAARTLERLAAGVSLTAARDTDERSLYTELDGIAPVERVLPVAEVYSEAEARQEAGRCLQCQCLVCVKACVYLQKYKGYPRVYARQMYNNAAIVKGLHLANNLINGCALCGQCEELCPENFSMAELCLSARQDMVERGVMPPSAHEFALEDMEAASGPECALSIRGGEGGWLFFPGCQLAASRGEQVEALYAWLRDALAGQGEFAPGLERGPVSLLLRCWRPRRTFCPTGAGIAAAMGRTGQAADHGRLFVLPLRPARGPARGAGPFPLGSAGCPAVARRNFRRCGQGHLADHAGPLHGTARYGMAGRRAFAGAQGRHDPGRAAAGARQDGLLRVRRSGLVCPAGTGRCHGRSPGRGAAACGPQFLHHVP